MRKVIAGLAMALALFLSACAPQVTAGDVVDKSMEDAYTTQEEIMEEECGMDTDTKIVNGKTKTTTEYECEDVGTGEYRDVEHPAQYEVTLEDAEGNTSTHSVDENQYNSVEVGDFLDLGKGE